MSVDPIAIARQQLEKLAPSLESPGFDSGMRLDIANLAARIEIADRLRGIEQTLDNGLRVWIDK